MGHHRKDSISKDSYKKELKESISSSKMSKSESKPIRDGALKGLTDALKLKLSKNDDVKIENDKLDELVKTIERCLYIFYNKDVGNKYKTKYRSLVFNIKDDKNNGLFRKIINGTITPEKLVEMSPEDMANKELKEWRQAELKQDIEKIKEHEIDLLKLGSKIVIKSHKGEEIKEQEKTDVKLPELLTMPSEKKKSDSKDRSNDPSYRAYKKVRSSKTWDCDICKNDEKSSSSQERKDSRCDVCNGRMTKEEVVLAKIEREK